MDKKQQIEEMAVIMQSGELARHSDEKRFTRMPFDTILRVGQQRLDGAEALIDAGYGNLREFAEKLKEIVHKVDFINGYAEIGLCDEIDGLLKEYLKCEV